jgi:hypothetical protein
MFVADVSFNDSWINFVQKMHELIDNSLLFQKTLDLVVIVGHFAEFIRTCFEALCKIIAEWKQLYQILYEQLQNDLLSCVYH